MADNVGKQTLNVIHGIRMTSTLEKEVETMGMAQGWIEKGMEKGIKIGVTKGQCDMIIEMLKHAIPIEQVAAISKYPIKKIQEIAEQNKLV